MLRDCYILSFLFFRCRALRRTVVHLAKKRTGLSAREGQTCVGENVKVMEKFHGIWVRYFLYELVIMTVIYMYFKKSNTDQRKYATEYYLVESEFNRKNQSAHDRRELISNSELSLEPHNFLGEIVR